MRDNLRTLLPYLRRYRKSLALGGAALLVKDMMGAVLPWFIGRGVDAMRGSAFRLDLVFWFSAAIVGFSVVKGIFQ
jgi:ABC-type multidrug transport system fused ATPase/permease subunit